MFKDSNKIKTEIAKKVVLKKLISENTSEPLEKNLFAKKKYAKFSIWILSASNVSQNGFFSLDDVTYFMHYLFVKNVLQFLKL